MTREVQRNGEKDGLKRYGMTAVAYMLAKVSHCYHYHYNLVQIYYERVTSYNLN